MEFPRLYRVNAIVIRRANLGEADRLVTFFTQEKGKIRAVARGARKATAKLSAATELFNVVRLQIARGKSLDLVAQCETVEVFLPLRQDLARFHLASVAAELCDILFEEFSPHGESYGAFLAALRQMSSGEAATALMRFVMQLAQEAGFAPQLYKCAVCDKDPINPRFSPNAGGLVCGSCALDALPLQEQDLESLRVIAGGEESPSPSSDTALHLLLRLLEVQSGHTLKSTKMLHLGG
jgi:DNA repair protein RecO (recombination protein O)